MVTNYYDTIVLKDYQVFPAEKQRLSEGCQTLIWYQGGGGGGRASVARPDVQDQFTHDPICEWMMVVVVMMMSKTTSSIPWPSMLCNMVQRDLYSFEQYHYCSACIIVVNDLVLS